jgi:hypothetical protein
MKNTLPTINELIKMFTQINKDCAKKGETVVALDEDWEYYAEQIENIYGCSFEEADELAQAMAKEFKKSK